MQLNLCTHITKKEVAGAWWRGIVHVEIYMHTILRYVCVMCIHIYKYIFKTQAAEARGRAPSMLIWMCMSYYLCVCNDIYVYVYDANTHIYTHITQNTGGWSSTTKHHQNWYIRVYHIYIYVYYITQNIYVYPKNTGGWSPTTRHRQYWCIRVFNIDVHMYYVHTQIYTYTTKNTCGWSPATRHHQYWYLRVYNIDVQMYRGVHKYYVNTHICTFITKTQVAGARRQDIFNIDVYVYTNSMYICIMMYVCVIYIHIYTHITQNIGCWSSRRQDIININVKLVYTRVSHLCTYI